MKATTVLGLPALEKDGIGQEYVVILAGLHGDEPAPVLAVNAMLPVIETWEMPVLVVQNANPGGIATQTRSPDWLTSGSIGADDMFADEIERSRDVALFLDLHEDGDALFPYLFAYGDRTIPISLRTALYGIASPFQIKPPRWMKREHPDAEIFEGIVWDREDGSADVRVESKSSIVVETPERWPLVSRVSYHCFVIGQVPSLYYRALDIPKEASPLTGPVAPE